MKVYKNKITYEIEFISTKKPDSFNPSQVRKTIKQYLYTHNFSVGDDKLVLDTKEGEM